MKNRKLGRYIRQGRCKQCGMCCESIGLHYDSDEM